MKKCITALTLMIAMIFSIGTASADIQVNKLFSPKSQNVKARLVIDIGPYSYHSWILKGIQDGTFAKYGVDIKFVGTGPGSVKTGLAITAGKAELGYQDYSGVVIVNSKQATPKFKAIFVIDDKVQDGIWSLKGSGINKFDDLDGKTFGDFITGTTKLLLPGITKAKVNPVNMSFSALVPGLVTGKVDTIGGYLTTTKFNLQKVGIFEYNVIKLSDAFPMGVSRVITVNSDWANANPKAIVGIRAAIRELLPNFIKDPKSSVDTLSGPLVSTQEKRDLELARAKYAIEELVWTNNVKVNGFSNAKVLGPRLKEYTDLLVSRVGLPNRHPDNTYFDLD